MATPQPIPLKKPWFIGWAFQFKNAVLDFDLFGSPFEIVQQMNQAGIKPGSAASHIATEISVRMVHKDGRIGKFRGGPNAPGLMRLLGALLARNWDVARQVLKQYPMLLREGDETASVPLCLSSALGDSESVEFLIAVGAPVDGADSLGMTPLHWSAVHNQPAIAAILLDAGANRSLRNWFFLTPENLAHANGHIDVLRVMGAGNAEASKVKLKDILHAMGCIGEK